MFRFQARLLSAIDGMSAQDRALVRMFLGRRADRSTVAALDVGDVDLPFPSPDKLVMLSRDDAFPGRVLNLDRWRPAFSQTDRPGFRIRQQDGLYLRFPEGFTDRVFGSEPPIVPLFGLSSPGTALWGGVEHRRTLSGDFTVEVDFDRFQQATAPVSSPTPVPAGIVRAGLMVNSLNTEQRTVPLAAVYRTANPAGPGDVWESQILPGLPPFPTQPASGTSGSLRIQRVSGQLSTWFRPTGGIWTQVGATTAFAGDNLRVALLLETTYAPGAVRFTAFRETEQNDWPATATYESPIFDTGQPLVAWDVLTWSESLPANTDVVIDVATQNTTPFDTWIYSGGYTNPAGSSLAGRTGRYLRYRVTMTNAGAAASPEFSKPRLTFGTGWQDRDYGFDGRGNMTLKQVVTAAGTVTETRTVNDLNQVTQNVVVDSSGTIAWQFEWTLNGELKKKWYEVDGVEVVAWLYTWNEDGRLIKVMRIDTDPVTLVSTTILDVRYTYCSIGRMLTRTVHVQDGVPISNPVPARYEWDGWDLVREVDADGTETNYYAPLGEVLSFKRGGQTYQLHADALGSVSGVTDAVGGGTSAYIFNAWGDVIEYSGTPANPAVGFVGTLGVRTDPVTGLIFMRHRWYSPGLSRFVSPDPLTSQGWDYRYALNRPAGLVDRFGLSPDCECLRLILGDVPFPVDVPSPIESIANLLRRSRNVIREIAGTIGSLPVDRSLIASGVEAQVGTNFATGGVNAEVIFEITTVAGIPVYVKVSPQSGIYSFGGFSTPTKIVSGSFTGNVAFNPDESARWEGKFIFANLTSPIPECPLTAGAFTDPSIFDDPDSAWKGGNFGIGGGIGLPVDAGMVKYVPEVTVENPEGWRWWLDTDIREARWGAWLRRVRSGCLSLPLRLSVSQLGLV